MSSRVLLAHVTASAAHAKLEVYERALDAAVLLDEAARDISDDRSDLKDLLHEASALIPLAIADGASEFNPTEKARSYREARRAAARCMAILDIAERVLAASPREEARVALANVMAMLSRLVTAQARRQRAAPRA